MADELSPTEVGPTIDATLQEFGNDVFLNARAAAENEFDPQGVESPTFPNYTAWLADLTAAIRNNVDISQDADFQQSASSARVELSPYFAPTRDTDLQQAELDPQYLSFYSDQLIEIFIGQSGQIRDAAANYLVQNYSISAGA